MLWTAACVSAHASTQSLDESFKSTLPLQNLHRSNLHYRTSLPNKTLMGNVAWNSREIYSAKKPLHGCTPFSILVMTQTSVLMLWVEDLYMADRGGKKRKKLITLNISAWLEILKLMCTVVENNRMNGSVSGLCAAPHLGAMTYSPFLWTKQKSCCSLPHSGLHHPPAVYTKLNTLSNGWLKNPPPLLYVCGTTQTKPTLMLQTHLCQLASHCQAQLLSITLPLHCGGANKLHVPLANNEC